MAQRLFIIAMLLTLSACSFAVDTNVVEAVDGGGLDTSGGDDVEPGDADERGEDVEDGEDVPSDAVADADVMVDADTMDDADATSDVLVDATDAAGDVDAMSDADVMVDADDVAVDVPITLSIGTLWFYNAANGERLFEMEEGMTIDLAALPSRMVNIEAVVSGEAGSVGFDLDGTPTRENVFPYFIGGDSNGVPRNWSVEVGPHVLTVTPYLAADLGGEPGTPLVLNFVVIDGG